MGNAASFACRLPGRSQSKECSLLHLSEPRVDLTSSGFFRYLTPTTLCSGTPGPVQVHGDAPVGVAGPGPQKFTGSLKWRACCPRRTAHHRITGEGGWGIYASVRGISPASVFFNPATCLKSDPFLDYQVHRWKLSPLVSNNVPIWSKYPDRYQPTQGYVGTENCKYPGPLSVTSLTSAYCKHGCATACYYSVVKGTWNPQPIPRTVIRACSMPFIREGLIPMAASASGSIRRLPLLFLSIHPSSNLPLAVGRNQRYLPCLYVCTSPRSAATPVTRSLHVRPVDSWGH